MLLSIVIDDKRLGELRFAIFSGIRWVKLRAMQNINNRYFLRYNLIIGTAPKLSRIFVLPNQFVFLTGKPHINEHFGLGVLYAIKLSRQDGYLY